MHVGVESVSEQLRERQRPPGAEAFTLSHPLRKMVDMSISIDCGTCVRQHTDTCDDCMVTFIANREPDEAVVIDVMEFAALKRLHRAGMVPGLRHEVG